MKQAEFLCQTNGGRLQVITINDTCVEFHKARIGFDPSFFKTGIPKDLDYDKGEKISEFKIITDHNWLPIPDTKKKYVRLSEDDKDNLYLDHLDGKSQRHLCEKYSISSTSCSRFIAQKEIDFSVMEEQTKEQK